MKFYTRTLTQRSNQAPSRRSCVPNVDKVSRARGHVLSPGRSLCLHFVAAGLVLARPWWMNLIATHTGCMQSSKCLLRRDSLARSIWTAHAAHASTAVYPCMHRVPTKHALSFAHGDRSFKGVFHTSLHFN